MTRTMLINKNTFASNPKEAQKQHYEKIAQDTAIILTWHKVIGVASGLTAACSLAYMATTSNNSQAADWKLVNISTLVSVVSLVKIFKYPLAMSAVKHTLTQRDADDNDTVIMNKAMHDFSSVLGPSIGVAIFKPRYKCEA